jgi:hypothetical protein
LNESQSLFADIDAVSSRLRYEKLIETLERSFRSATEPELRAKRTAAIVLLRDLDARSNEHGRP